MGEAQVGNAWEVCTEGTYNIQPEDGCIKCDTSISEWHGSKILFPKPGYWRKSMTDDTFWECPNKDAWIGSPDYPDVISYTGECADGYHGNMCHSCSEGYARNQRNTCEKCPNDFLNFLRLALVVVTCLMVVALLVKASLAAAIRPRRLHSVYLKIFFNYI